VVTASFFAPDYRRDIRRYYEWVHARFVRPYRDTLLMLNLADEPTGGDYSRWAEAEFTARTGYGFAEVGDDPARLVQLGAFQSVYVAEYAAWSAEQWAELEPSLPTTMSFEGATARLHFQLPQVEALFARTPPTFYPTFDAYPRDGPPELPLDDAELIRLFTLVRSLGHYSARHDRPFWLWSAANSWGLAQASADPADVADAVANGYYLALLARQTGGWLQGIAVWNYNVYGQGLYNDTHRTRYDPEAMFAEVSESLPRIRRLLAAPPGRTRVLVVAPDRYSERLLGLSRTSDPWDLHAYEFHWLAAFARNNVPAAVVAGLAGEDLSDVGTVVLLARDAEDVVPADVAQLRAYHQAGGTVLAARALGSALSAGASYLEADPPEAAFADPPTRERAALWQWAFGLDRPLAEGFLVSTAEDALLYTIGRRLEAEVLLPFAGRGWVVESGGCVRQPLRADGGRLPIALEPHQYAYLTR
jgi:hypothetical protein